MIRISEQSLLEFTTDKNLCLVVYYSTMAEAQVGVSWDEFASDSFAAVNSSSRVMLSRHLDPSLSTLSSNGYLQDWRGLAELVGLDATDIQIIRERPGGEYTEQVMKKLTVQKKTIGQLVDYFNEMERYDILEDELLLRRVGQDVALFNENQRLGEVHHAQVPTASSADDIIDDSSLLVLGDDVNRKEYFHAFVCYAPGDFDFVQQMMTHLEDEKKLKLCIPSRDLRGGTVKYSAIAELIEHRCRRVLVLLSEEYLNSDECDFQTKFTQSLSPGYQNRKLVPIIIKPMTKDQVPSLLRCLTIIDYTRSEVHSWFWPKIVKCLTETFPRKSGDGQREVLNDQDVLNVSTHL